MPDETSDNGGNRATVAMVYRAVDDQGKVMLAEFGTVAANFRAVNSRLDSLSTLPATVEVLSTRILTLEAQLPERAEERLRALEAEWDRRKASNTYRTVNLPAILIALASLVLALIVYLSSSGAPS